MKKKNNKKLARNAIRARKAVKKRENEQNAPKQRKRIVTRIASLLGCLLLVSVLALPCFADDGSSRAVTNYKAIFFDYYGLSAEDGDGLYWFMNSTYFEEVVMMYVYQFTGLSVGDTVHVDEMLTFNDTNALFYSSGCVYDNANYQFYYLGPGYWETSFTSSGSDRVFKLMFYEYNDGGDSNVLTLRIRYNTSTLVVSESSVSSPTLPLVGTTEELSIGVGADVLSHVVLDYVSSFGYINCSLAVNYDDFIDGVNVSYDAGYEAGSALGYTDGYNAGYEVGYAEGDTHGFSVGASQGYNLGWSAGYEAGLANNDVYQQGYDDAVSQIEDGDFGRNFLGATLNAPLEALRQFTIVEWTTEGGAIIEINLISVLSAVVGISLFIWFLKMFAGG